jgi:squalene synthase HpnC
LSSQLLVTGNAGIARDLAPGGPSGDVATATAVTAGTPGGGGTPGAGGTARPAGDRHLQAPVESGLDAVLAKAASENFPVALRLLPSLTRGHLLAVYGFARFVDDLGDLAGGDRLAQLDWAEAELDRALAGTATRPVFAAAGEMASACGAPRQPFADLIAANRQDQVVLRYATFGELVGYCALSANPVGRLVLAVFGRSGPLLEGWSDSICTGLQLVEHWQDVAEDYRAGRVYLPLEDLAHFGVDEEELGGGVASPAFRRLMAFETARAVRWLHAGRPLVAALSGAARFAVAGFLGGGLAQSDAIAAAGYDVLAHQVKASKRAVARRGAAELVAASPLAGVTRRGRWS